jgi:hypothetical protein
MERIAFCRAAISMAESLGEGAAPNEHSAA